jgi:hypothetical protein
MIVEMRPVDGELCMRFMKAICQQCYAENELAWDEVHWCQGFILCPSEFERKPVQQGGLPCDCFGYYSRTHSACKRCALVTECEKASKNKVCSLAEDDVPKCCPYRLEHIMNSQKPQK